MYQYLLDNYNIIHEAVHYGINSSNIQEFSEAEKRVLDLEEEPLIVERRSPSNEKIELETLEKSVTCDPHSNHYFSELLWRENIGQLPTEEALNLAVKRMKKFVHVHRGKELYNECENQINNLLINGYARELNFKEVKHYTENQIIHPSL